MASDVCSQSKPPDETEVAFERAMVTPGLLSAAQCPGKVRRVPASKCLAHTHSQALPELP